MRAFRLSDWEGLSEITFNLRLEREKGAIHAKILGIENLRQKEKQVQRPQEERSLEYSSNVRISVAGI